MRIASTFGDRVREHRTARGWSQAEMAARLDLSRRLLIQIEQGRANPSLSTMLAIADGLGVDFAALVDGADGARADIVGPVSPKVLWSTETASQAELLAASGPLELWQWLLQPGDERRSEAHAANSRECLTVQRGEVTVEIGSTSVTARTGQALSFTAASPHRYRNCGTQPAAFTLAVFDPLST